MGRLYDLATMVLIDRSPRRVISGMQLGWDLAIAEAACSLDIPYIAAIPFEAHVLHWSQDDIRHYSRLVDQASEVVFVTPGDWTVVPRVAYQRRNEWIVNNCDRLIALWDGTASGTKNCIDYAIKIGRPWENVWNLWRPSRAQQRNDEMLS